MHAAPVTAFYAAILGLVFIAITLRIALGRYSRKLSLGDGGDKDFNKLIRGHGNFAETVPITLILLLLLELQNTSPMVLHTLAIALLAGRALHYLQLTGLLQPLLFRSIGMILTLSTILIASILLLSGF